MTEQELLEAFDAECVDIADQCEEEGLPAHGSTYDVRCAHIWENYYLPDLQYINPEKWGND